VLGIDFLAPLNRQGYLQSGVARETPCEGRAFNPFSVGGAIEAAFFQDCS
jgi:hypothetical protein